MKDDWKQRAERLYEIIDNIDTASDVAKGNDIAYRELVKKQIEKSQEIVRADGGGRVIWAGDVG